jgi:ABC-2 type transport system ATP-binding protein
MSRGNRQKVAIVMALAHQPRLVILDEPTSGLDPLMQETLLQCLREMALAGHTVMFSSHTLSEVESLCDHVAIVKDGQIVEDSTVCRLKALAPRQIVVTLRPNQHDNDISWPAELQPVTPQGSDPVRPGTNNGAVPFTKNRTRAFELTGTSVSFLQWASSQHFEDVTIGPPSLEVLFRRYYNISQDMS